jgi:hypothetical protein
LSIIILLNGSLFVSQNYHPTHPISKYSFLKIMSIKKFGDRLTVLIFFPSRKQAGGGDPPSLPPELSWNLKTDRRSD